MWSSHPLATVAGLIVLINLPFGFWRGGTRRFSRSWMLAVHAPVPLAIGIRFAAGLGWRLQLLPLFVAAYFAGQFIGGRVRRWVEAPRFLPPEAPSDQIEN